MPKVDRNILGDRKEHNPGPTNPYRGALDQSWKEKDMDPQEEADKAQHETRMELETAAQESAKTDAARQRAEREKLGPGAMANLSPEQQGQILGDLVAGYVRAGIPTQRAYVLALQGLNPEAVPQQPKPAGDEESIAKTVFKAVFDDFLEHRKNPPVQPPIAPTTPLDAVAQMEQMAETQRRMGETYMKQMFGLTAEDIAKLRSSPGGNAQLANVGANLEQQLRVSAFEDEQKRKWARFDMEMAEWKAEQRRKEREHESSMRTKETLSDSAGRLFGAGERAMDSLTRQSAKELAEEKAEKTGVNPVCPECGADLSTDGPEGYLVCSNPKCGKSFPIEEVS